MSTVITAGYPDLNDLRIATQNYLVDAYAQYPMTFLEYFDSSQTSNFTSEKISQLGGVPAPDAQGENADLPEVTPVEGYDVTATHLYYPQVLKVSRIQIQDDVKGVFANFQNQINMHYKAGYQRASILASTVLNTAASTVGPDGQYIIDTDHPTSPTNATTLSNLITTKLDAGGVAVQDVVTKIGTNGKDMAGNQILFGRWKLVVPPALASNAYKSCVALYGTAFSISSNGAFTGVVGGRSNPTPIQTGDVWRTSTTTGQSIQVVVDPFLGSGYTNGSDVKWYLIADPAEAPGTHSLRWYWREPPTVLPPFIDQKNLSIKIPFVMRASATAIDWRHIWGSSGTV